MAQLGYNLMRIHHHDSEWVKPNIFGTRRQDTRHLDAKSLDSLDWWIKCLKDEGIYIWLDMHVGRVLKPGDGLTAGADEIAKNNGGLTAVSAYYNTPVQTLMKEFQHNYLDHVNRYTKLRYKDDPAVDGRADHQRERPDESLRQHDAAGQATTPCTTPSGPGATRHSPGSTGCPANRVFQTWVPGPSKLYLAQAEHEFNRTMIADLRRSGVKAPIATTNFWGSDPLFSLPPLTDGDLIDVHSYGESEELEQERRTIRGTS